MRKKLTSLWSNKYIQGSFFLTTSAFMANFLNYLFHFFAGRILGPSGYGEITTLFSYISLSSVPITVFSTIIIQKISEKNTDKLAYASAIENHFWIKVKKWWFLLTPLILLIPFMPWITNLSPMVACLIIPMVLVGFISTVYGSILQGLKLFLFVSVFSLFGVILKLTSISMPLFNMGGINSVVIFYFISTLITLIILWFVVKKKILNPFLINSNNVIIKRTLFRFIFDPQFGITLLSILAITILSNLDIIFVKKFFTPFEAGIYGSWSIFAKIILYVIGPMMQVSFVFFASNAQKKSQERVLLLAIIILIFVGISGYVGYKTIGTNLIDIFFGSKFDSVRPYLGQASIFGSLYTLIVFFNNYFLAKKNKYSLLLFSMIPLYVILLFLIPKTLFSIINLNILFTLTVSILYLIAFLILKPKTISTHQL